MGGGRPIRAWLLALAALGTLLLGVSLRWFFVGGPLWGDFAHLRHAHSHLGFFGLLFPLMWWAWELGGAPAPGRRWGLLYLAGVVLSTLGFALSGYGPLSIIGSTVVLLVWMVSAWGIRDRLLQRDWLAVVAPGIVLAAAFIPPVALLSKSDPTLSADLARSFLSLLVLAVIIPSALRSLQIPAPRPWLWLGAAVAGSLFLGPARSFALGAGLVALGLSLLLGLRRGTSEGEEQGPVLPWDIKALWALAALSFVATGVGVLPHGGAAAVAGIHFLILGPLMWSLGRPLLPRVSSTQRLVLHGCTGSMTVAILLAHKVAWFPTLAAVSGTVLAVWWGQALIRGASRRRPSAGSAQSSAGSNHTGDDTAQSGPLATASAH